MSRALPYGDPSRPVDLGIQTQTSALRYFDALNHGLDCRSTRLGEIEEGLRLVNTQLFRIDVGQDFRVRYRLPWNSAQDSLADCHYEDH